jgi:uncharacterized membrane protein
LPTVAAPLPPWGLIVAGLRRHYAPIRYFAIVVFAGTILKVFMIDLASLDKIYRVISVIGLGVVLLLTSYLYQRSPAAGPEESTKRVGAA